MRLYKEKNKQSSAAVQKTLINSEYLLGQFQRRCNNPQYQKRIKLQIILTIAKKAAPRMENSTDRLTQGRIKSPLARKAFFYSMHNI